MKKIKTMVATALLLIGATVGTGTQPVEAHANSGCGTSGGVTRAYTYCNYGHTPFRVKGQCFQPGQSWITYWAYGPWVNPPGTSTVWCSAYYEMRYAQRETGTHT